MIRIALRDLQFRRRRFAIAAVGAALVFAVSLVVQGLAESFQHEAASTLEHAGVATWFVSDRSTGPFTGFSPLAAEQLDALRRVDPDASPMLVTRQPIGEGDDRKDAALVGVAPGGLGSPRAIEAGRGVRGEGEAVVSRRAGYPLGGRVVVGGVPLRVVGLVGDTLMGGANMVTTSLTQAQAIVGAGAVVTVVVSAGRPETVPPGVAAMDDAAVERASLRPLQEAIDTISMMRTILWGVAALIVGAMLYLNALERHRDVAVMKAVGLTGASIAGSVLLQAAVLALVAGIAADVLALGLAPVFPMQVDVTAAWLVVLPLLAVGVSCVAGLVAVRRAVGTPPALAFGGA